MARQHDSQIKKLDKKIANLKKTLAGLGDGKHLDELFIIIHSPGWTTLRELAFSMALVDSMTAHAQALTKTQTALVHGAKKRSAGE